MEGEKQNSLIAENAWWHPLYEFGIHVFVGSGVFLLIAIPAVFLNFLVHWLENFGIDGWISSGLIGVEYFLFFADILLFVIFIVSTLVKTGKKLWIKTSH